MQIYSLLYVRKNGEYVSIYIAKDPESVSPLEEARAKAELTLNSGEDISTHADFVFAEEGEGTVSLEDLRAKAGVSDSE